MNTQANIEHLICETKRRQTVRPLDLQPAPSTLPTGLTSGRSSAHLLWSAWPSLRCLHPGVWQTPASGKQDGVSARHMTLA